MWEYRDRLRHVLCRHEQGAGHAAEGYARSTGKAGVCVATSGPGATNLVTPIANAWMDSTPLVAITGQVSSAVLGKDAFQETEEATAKLQRAQLSSCQLPTYYAGLKGWLAVRDDYKQRRGSAYSLRDFNESALKQGGVPLPLLIRLLQ